MTQLTDAGALQRLADELEIRNLLGRRTHFRDAGDIDAFVSCWTEDAVREAAGYPTVRGRAGIRAMAEGLQRKMAESGSMHRHVVTNMVIEMNGSDEATCESLLLFMADTATAPRIEAIYHTRDTLRRTPQGWKLAHRRSTRG